MQCTSGVGERIDVLFKRKVNSAFKKYFRMVLFSVKIVLNASLKNSLNVFHPISATLRSYF